MKIWVNQTYYEEVFGWTPLECGLKEYTSLSLRDCSLNYQYIYGRRSKFYICPNDNNLFMVAQIFASRELKLDMIFSVVDKNVISNFSYESHSVGGPAWIDPTLCHARPPYRGPWVQRCVYHMIWKQKILANSYHIVVSQYYRVKLSLFGRNISMLGHIRLFDGPDEFSAPAKMPLRYWVSKTGNQARVKVNLMLSTFQCYLHVFWPLKDQSFVVVNIETAQQHVENVLINNTYFFSAQSVMYHTHKNHQVKVLNVSSSKSYLNVSLHTITYDGPNTLGCAHGGIIFFKPHKGEHTAQVILCENYTKNPGINSFDKVPMDHVTSTSNLLLVIYNYPPTSMDVRIQISATPCRGVFACSKGNVHH